ncbi:MAG: hypothetical protein KAH17_03960 [Bacteroidales bacterium]|nr:hypothetical protein [Bacteroidales bacterium]
MKTQTSIFITLLAIVAVFASCTKDQLKKDHKIDYSLEYIQDEIVLEDLMHDLFLEIEESNLWLDGFKNDRDRSDCRVITIEPEERGVFPKTITIDFGTGCEIKEGLSKKGKIIIEMTAAPYSDEWTKTIRFERYSVNDKSFEGGKNISFNIEGRRGLPTWEIVSRIKIKWDEESSVQQSMQRTRMQTAGFETPRRPMDDSFVMTGTTTGRNRKGQGYATTITEPLFMSKDCRWIKKGAVEFKVRGESDAVLDYGDGTCDDLATFTKDGKTKEIHLRKK